MMARRTGVFHKQNTVTVNYNRFLPLPASKRCPQGEDDADAAPRSKKDVQVQRNRRSNVRSFSDQVEQQQQPGLMETPEHRPETTLIRSTSERVDNEDVHDENESVPNVEKDDMMARRTRTTLKPVVSKPVQSFNQFLPVPGSVKYNVSPVSAMKPLHNKPKTSSESSIVSVAAAAEVQAPPPSFTITSRRSALRPRQEEDVMRVSNTRVTDVTEPVSSPSLSPPPSLKLNVEEKTEKQRTEEKVEQREEEERKESVNEQQQKKKWSWTEDDALPPMMMSRRVAFMSEDTESVSMNDMNEETGHVSSLSQSRYERMQEQFSSFKEDEDHWQDDLARWKNRRRSASQDLIKKDEERKRMERRLKDDGGDGNKRKSIKTYKEIVEEKERREAELCDAYRNAATPEEAAMVLQRYALRFTISDATLDSLKLPRSNSDSKPDENQLHGDIEPSSASSPAAETSESETSEPLTPPKPQPAATPEPASTPEPQPEPAAKPEPASTPEPAAKPELQPETEPASTPEQPEEAETTVSPSVTESENKQPETIKVNEPQHKLTEAPTESQPEQRITDDASPQIKPQIVQTSPQIKPVQPQISLPSPPPAPSRPVPLLVAKPYRQPKNMTTGHKPVKMDGLVRVNGEATEDFSVSTTTSSSPQPPSPLEVKDVAAVKQEEDVSFEETTTTTEQPTPPASERTTTISSLIGGRTCVITTTIVTELTQTLVEPHHTDVQVNGNTTTFGSTEEKKCVSLSSPSSVQDLSPTVTESLDESSVTTETPMLNLAKRVNHWVWDPNEERKRLERWQQEQERLLQEQYQREQEKLKKEWEKAQLEVEEEERKHNEEERRILEETVMPLNPGGLLLNQQPLVQTETTSPTSENNKTEKRNVTFQQNDQRISTTNEDQHASKLLFFQDSTCDGDTTKKQEMWKTSSLDRNLQQNQTQSVKRSGSHDVVAGKQQPSSSSSSPQPPSPSRCVSGKRLCSGCSQPLGKGAAMIIDTLGLFFHIQCFKCAVCEGQLGDATTGTDVRIRNGLLSCHECYIATRGRGQPTTL